MPSRILVLYAHPHPHLSVANRHMARAIKDLSNIELVDLYETSPDFHFDVAAEQHLLEQADLLVFQHPLCWYGMPALLKHWTETVLTRGWAYGHGGHALRGKDFMLALTTGGNSDDYQPEALHGHHFDAFLPPFRQIAHYCGMQWQAPLVLHAARRSDPAVLDAHAQRYRQLLQAYPNWRAAAPNSSGQD